MHTLAPFEIFSKGVLITFLILTDQLTLEGHL